MLTENGVFVLTNTSDFQKKSDQSEQFAAAYVLLNKQHMQMTHRCLLG